MKTIGLIGGMSWESTSEYYRIINEQVKAKRGGLHSAKCLLYSVNFAEIVACQKAGDWKKAAEILAQAAKSLEIAGADCLLICTNTMHIIADQVQQAVQIPLFHIGDSTAKQVLGAKIGKVGLLGTKYTLEQDFYKLRLRNFGLDVRIPEPDDIDFINRVIFEELCQGIIRSESRREFLRIINHLAEQGAEGIILGCTEIMLLVKQEDTSMPLFDTTQIHAEWAANFAMEDDM